MRADQDVTGYRAWLRLGWEPASPREAPLAGMILRAVVDGVEVCAYEPSGLTEVWLRDQEGAAAVTVSEESFRRHDAAGWARILRGIVKGGEE